MKRLDHYWYSRNPVAMALLPLSWLFCLLVLLRRLAYRLGWLQTVRLQVSVVVVGNLTVGGSGKTPLVIHLAERLRQAGFRPGIVSRGYGGQSTSWPQAVHPDSDPRLVGDEPVLIARRSGCPLWVGPDRVAAARALLEQNDCNLILADDGLQHYRLGRDLEIVVIDGRRRFGNGFCLPAGPLREPAWRLRRAALVINNGGVRAGECSMQLQGERLLGVTDETRGRALTELAGQPVHAVAGIGDPQRFFDTLRRAGLKPIEHPFADHHRFEAAEIRFDDELPVLMTEKDAVKCRELADARHWYLPIRASLPPTFDERLLTLLNEVIDGQKTA